MGNRQGKSGQAPGEPKGFSPEQKGRFRGMDICFHYYAVKAIAMVSGFNEDDAQTIAGYSQFVDDFNRYANMKFQGTTIPECLKKELLEETSKETLFVKQNKDHWVLNPVSTGFETIVDIAFTSGLARNQKWIVVPFHFIPAKPLNQVPNGTDYRTQRASIIGVDGDGKPTLVSDHSIISELLIKAREDYQKAVRELQNPKSTQEDTLKNWQNRHYALIWIGALLHTFADTLAHEQFNGFTSDLNKAHVSKVIRHYSDPEKNDEDGNIKGYQPSKVLPAAGHGQVLHAPDHTCISFEFQFEGKNPYKYERNNTDTFLEMAEQISDYLRSCNSKTSLADLQGSEKGVWDDFKKRLKKCFTDIKLESSQNGDDIDVSQVQSLYQDEFSAFGYEFAYQKEDYMPKTGSTSYFEPNEDFFWFNAYCNITRRKVAGEQFKPSEVLWYLA